MDMSKSYRAAAKKHLAGIPIIFGVVQNQVTLSEKK